MILESGLRVLMYTIFLIDYCGKETLVLRTKLVKQVNIHH